MTRSCVCPGFVLMKIKLLKACRKLERVVVSVASRAVAGKGSMRRINPCRSCSRDDHHGTTQQVASHRQGDFGPAAAVCGHVAEHLCGLQRTCTVQVESVRSILGDSRCEESFAAVKLRALLRVGVTELGDAVRVGLTGLTRTTVVNGAVAVVVFLVPANLLG